VSNDSLGGNWRKTSEVWVLCREDAESSLYPSGRAEEGAKKTSEVSVTPFIDVKPP